MTGWYIAIVPAIMWEFRFEERKMMKFVKVATIVLLVLGSAVASFAGEAVPFQKQMPSVSTNEYLYEIKDNEVLVNDQLITLFAFSPKGISASYRNKTKETMRPKYVVEIYNPYGMLIGFKKLGEGIFVFGGSTFMEPGAVSSEDIYLDKYPLDRILKHANLKLPSDLLEMKWLVLSETNTRKTPEQDKSTVPAGGNPGGSSEVR